MAIGVSNGYNLFSMVIDGFVPRFRVTSKVPLRKYTTKTANRAVM